MPCATLCELSSGLAGFAPATLAFALLLFYGSSLPLAPDARAKRRHEIDHVGAVFRRLGQLDRFARGFALHEFAKGQLILILELRGIEVSGLLIQDVRGKLDH